jgi:hypothetical protein
MNYRMVNYQKAHDQQHQRDPQGLTKSGIKQTLQQWTAPHLIGARSEDLWPTSIFLVLLLMMGRVWLRQLGLF